MKTKSNNSEQKGEAEINGLLAMVELFDEINRRLGKDAIVAIPTKEDMRKEQKDATTGK